jgi:Outer membrane protein beta-barrel domain
MYWMKLKHSLLLSASTLFIFLSANSHAGREGVNAYYGLGFGAASMKNVDPAPTGQIVLGIEEDGWALEAIGYASTEVGTDNPETDISISGTDIGLAYRSIEKNDRYYKLKFSKTDLDLEDKETIASVTTTTTTATSGKSYTIGMGFRTSRENRVEVDYTLHNSDDLSDNVHLLSLKYLWGGAPYHGTSF